MLLELAIALILAKVMDELFIRKNQPPVIGEILVGVVLSISLFILPEKINMFNYEFPISLELSHPAFDFFADMGILFLLFLSGMEINFESMKKSGRAALLTGGMGVFVTFVVGLLFGAYFLGLTLRQSVVLGTIYTATSVGVTVRTLMEMRILSSKVGIVILTAAVADDILGIILVTIVLSTGEIAELIAGLLIFFLVLYVLSKYGTIKKLMVHADDFIHTPFGLVSFSVGLMLLFAYFAEISKIAGITGAFFAGLFIGQSTQEKKIINSVKAIAYSIFIPIFFVKVGTLVDLNLLTSFNFYLLLVIPLVFIGKTVGCGVGSLLGGMKLRDALRVGIGMTPEMEVALVIASLAYGSNIFGASMGSQIITVTITYVIISSMAVPFILKYLYRGEESSPQTMEVA